MLSGLDHEVASISVDFPILMVTNLFLPKNRVSGRTKDNQCASFLPHCLIVNAFYRLGGNIEMQF